jgi:DNA-binding MarR family transcriptional regulator
MNAAQRKRLVENLGLTKNQIDVLGAIGGPHSTGTTAGVVARRLDIHPSAVTRAAQVLEAAGFVIRCRSTHDNRVVYLYRTALIEQHMRPAPKAQATADL